MGIQITLDIISVAFAITWSMFRIRYIKKKENKLKNAKRSHRAAIAAFIIQINSFFLYVAEGSDGVWLSLFLCLIWIILITVSDIDCMTALMSERMISSEYKKEEVDDKDGDI